MGGLLLPRIAGVCKVPNSRGEEYQFHRKNYQVGKNIKLEIAGNISSSPSFNDKFKKGGGRVIGNYIHVCRRI